MLPHWNAVSTCTTAEWMELIKANQILLLHSVFEQFGLLTQFLFIVAAAPSVPEGNVVCLYIMRLVIDIPPLKEEIRKRFPGGVYRTSQLHLEKQKVSRSQLLGWNKCLEWLCKYAFPSCYLTAGLQHVCMCVVLSHPIHCDYIKKRFTLSLFADSQSCTCQALPFHFPTEALLQQSLNCRAELACDHNTFGCSVSEQLTVSLYYTHVRYGDHLHGLVFSQATITLHHQQQHLCLLT